MQLQETMGSNHIADTILLFILQRLTYTAERMTKRSKYFAHTPAKQDDSFGLLSDFAVQARFRDCRYRQAQMALGAVAQGHRQMDRRGVGEPVGRYREQAHEDYKRNQAVVTPLCGLTGL
jgi:hypothetical protein